MTAVGFATEQHWRSDCLQVSDAVKTVQLAIRDSAHALSLRDLLLVDGVHQVHLVERPNLAIAGVIVLDVDHLERSGALPSGQKGDDLSRF